MSSINPNNIDGTYPIAGQDNDSQGFRDNFTNIKNNFTFASAEIAELQQNAILKNALSGTTLNNNLNNSQLIAPQLTQFTYTINNLGTQSGSVLVNWTDAPVQTLTTGGAVTLALGNWPTSGFYATLTLQITVTNITHTLTFPSSVNLVNISGVSNQTLTFPTTGVYAYELRTLDGGTTVYAVDVFDAAGVVNGNLAIAGNLITQGGTINTGYQFYAPTGNLTFTANANVNRIILAPTGSAVSLYANITLPSGNVDGKTISISSTQQVQFLNVIPNHGCTIAPSGNVNLLGGNTATYFFHAVNSRWYKF